MFSSLTIVVACSAGLFGAVSTLVIGNRHTRNWRVLAWGGVCSGLTLALLSYFVASWCVHGFDPLQAWILPPAGLILLLVMAAQNWFVFYENHEDAAQSARPTLVLLSAVIASMIADRFVDERTSALQVIWAGAISLAILQSIRPVYRSIEVNRSIPVGVLVGCCKLLVPSTGIVAFILVGMLSRLRCARSDADQPSTTEPARVINLLLLLWEIGLLPLLTLINGARVTHVLSLSDPADTLNRQLSAASVADQMPRAARDTVVLILVLAVHVLCGVVIARD
jgi:hypothetical protein